MQYRAQCREPRNVSVRSQCVHLPTQHHGLAREQSFRARFVEFESAGHSLSNDTRIVAIKALAPEDELQWDVGARGIQVCDRLKPLKRIGPIRFRLGRSHEAS